MMLNFVTALMLVGMQPTSSTTSFPVSDQQGTERVENMEKKDKPFPYSDENVY